MKLIKLDAIDSTNDFLKALSNSQFVENFTVVTTEEQTNGKGQMGSKWLSEKGKNLTMSVLIKDASLDINQIYNLNVAVSLSILSVLEQLNVPKISIKWPNDILSANKKIAGILIENTFKSNGAINSVVGIGLNLNQLDFIDLPHASSLALIMGKSFDKEVFIEKIVASVKLNIARVLNNESDVLWKKYNESLFKINVPMPFEKNNGIRFMGIVKEVDKEGRLQLMLENDEIVSFEIKEIRMLY